MVVISKCNSIAEVLEKHRTPQRRFHAPRPALRRLHYHRRGLYRGSRHHREACGLARDHDRRAGGRVEVLNAVLFEGISC